MGKQTNHSHCGFRSCNQPRTCTCRWGLYMYMIHAVNMMRGTSNSFEVKASHTFHISCICTCQAVWIICVHVTAWLFSILWVHAQGVMLSLIFCTCVLCVCLLSSVSSGANVTKIICLGDLYVGTWSWVTWSLASQQTRQNRPKTGFSILWIVGTAHEHHK